MHRLRTISAVFALALFVVVAPHLHGQVIPTTPGIGVMPTLAPAGAAFCPRPSLPIHCPSPIRPCYPGYGYPGYGLGGYGLYGGGGFYGGGGGVVSVPVPYPVPTPVAPQETNTYVDSPRPVLSTVQVPSASGAPPIFIDVIRGERGPSQQLPFTPPKPKTRKAEAEEIPAASLAAVEAPLETPPQIQPGASPAALVEYLAHDSQDLQLQAVQSLLRLGGEGRTHLVGATRSNNPRVRAMALWSLGHEKATPEEMALIVAGMKDEDSGVRQQAVRAAGGLGSAASPAARERMLAALADGDEEVRIAASESIPALGPTVIPALIDALASDKESTRDASGRALIRLGEPAVAPLAAALSSKKSHVRFWAAYSLGEMGPSAGGAVPVLERMALADPDSNVRYYALAAVRKLAR